MIFISLSLSIGGGTHVFSRGGFPVVQASNHRGHQRGSLYATQCMPLEGGMVVFGLHIAFCSGGVDKISQNTYRFCHVTTVNGMYKPEYLWGLSFKAIYQLAKFAVIVIILCNSWENIATGTRGQIFMHVTTYYYYIHYCYLCCITLHKYIYIFVLYTMCIYLYFIYFLHIDSITFLSLFYFLFFLLFSSYCFLHTQMCNIFATVCSVCCSIIMVLHCCWNPNFPDRTCTE